MRNAKEMAKFLRDTEGYHATKVCSSDLMERAGILEAQQQEIERQKKRVDEYSKDYGAAVEIIAEKNQKIEQYKIALDGKEFANNNLFKLNQQLIQENEQLQAQNGAMREALRHGVDLADGLYGTSEFVCWAHDDAEPALSSEAGRNYHNPADVAEIERLKVLTLKPTVYVTGSTTRPLEQIDKAGGEK